MFILFTDREYLPMLKERLRKQIRNGGGRTYKSLHQVSNKT